MKATTIFFLIGFAAMVVGSQSCSEKAAASNAEIKTAFVINDTLMKHISFDTARLMPLIDELKLTGEVSFDDSKVSRVFAMQSGQIVEVKAKLGDFVQKGQTIAVLRSADMATNQADLISADADVVATRKALENTQELFKNGLAAQTDLTNAQNAVNKTAATLNKMREIVALNGGSGGSSRYELRAPMTGFILEKKANEGQIVRPDAADNLFTIGNLTDVWVMADVYETDLAKVHEGMSAVVTTLAYPDKVLRGKVSKINRVLDPLSKVAKARIQLDNPDGKLEPEMFANVTLTSPTGGQAVAVPSKSVIMDYSKNFVVVFKDRAHVEMREVTIIRTAADQTFVSGLQAGEQVVSQSNLLIFNALKS